jgi:CheY-like chemotaxis protein
MPIHDSTAVRDIFLVEDDDGLRTLEAKILSGLPEVGIREFEQAETALDCFEQTTPSLLISDLGLPGMSGVEFITRARSKFPRVPVLVTTGSQSDFERELRRLPFIELWEKPFSLQDLRDRVHDVLVAETAAEPAPEPFVFSPFSVVDYLQMANFGRRSLLLEVCLPDGRTGRVEILRGEIWRCRLGILRGLDALRMILAQPDVPVDFLPLTRIPKEREITSPTSGVLLELAVAQDEGRLTA